jgi:hypothetical protein
MCASRVMCRAERGVKGTGETNELTASRRELRASPHELALRAVNCAARIGDARRGVMDTKPAAAAFQVFPLRGRC